MAHKIAVAQVSPSTDAKKNISNLQQAVRRAQAEDVNVLVLTEYANYFDADQFGRGFTENAEEVGSGPYSAALIELAREARITIVAGILEKSAETRRVYNSMLVVNPAGEIVLNYHKIHLYNAYGGAESEFLVPGELVQEQRFSVDGINYGLITCYDMRFPEIMRQLPLDEIEVILMPSLWTPGPNKLMHWDYLTRTRAIENIAYVIASSPPEPVSTGHSRVIAPNGLTIAQAGTQAAFLTAELSKEQVQAERSANTSLSNRRFNSKGENS